MQLMRGNIIAVPLFSYIYWSFLSYVGDTRRKAITNHTEASAGDAEGIYLYELQKQFIGKIIFHFILFIKLFILTFVLQEWFSAVLANWKLWIPFQFLNFRFVPQQFQVLAANFIALVWNVVLSFIAHKEILQKQVCFKFRRRTIPVILLDKQKQFHAFCEAQYLISS